MSDKSSDSQLISTSALAKRLDLPAKTLFELFVNKSWIERVGDNWKLTGKGEFEGGGYVTSKKYGEYIGWPESVLEHLIFSELFNRPLRTRIIGHELGISAHRFNATLAELGWQKKFHRGWVLTSIGQVLGGKEHEDDESGVPYTLWPRTILDNPLLQESLKAIRLKPWKASSDDNSTEVAPVSSDEKKSDDQQQALNFNTTDNNQTLIAMDGHHVHHPEDQALDNWLYLMGVVHAYQRTLSTPELGCCDFYLPTAHLHIECWHAKDGSGDLNQKLARLEYYQSNQLAYCEVSADDLEKLDTVLPKLLLKNGITVF